MMKALRLTRRRRGLSLRLRFAAALAKRYADEAIIWELWNEPNLDNFWKPKPNVADYMKWVKSVVSAIRESDPGACIIAPATSGFDFLFIESCFKQGLLDLVDGISVHPYRNASMGPETAIDEYNTLAAMIEHYTRGKKQIPIISGEWGYTTSEMAPELQGKYLARQWLCNMAHHIPVSIWYDWHDDGQDANEREHNFGTVTWDYQPQALIYRNEDSDNRIERIPPGWQNQHWRRGGLYRGVLQWGPNQVRRMDNHGFP